MRVGVLPEPLRVKDVGIVADAEDYGLPYVFRSRFEHRDHGGESRTRGDEDFGGIGFFQREVPEPSGVFDFCANRELGNRGGSASAGKEFYRKGEGFRVSFDDRVGSREFPIRVFERDGRVLSGFEREPISGHREFDGIRSEVFDLRNGRGIELRETFFGIVALHFDDLYRTELPGFENGFRVPEVVVVDDFGSRVDFENFRTNGLAGSAGYASGDDFDLAYGHVSL